MIDLKVREFDFKKDVQVFSDMLKGRGEFSELDLNYFPPTGFIVECDNKPVCVGFVILCDNKTAIGSDIVSDIEAPSLVRNSAVKLLRTHLEIAAYNKGCDYMIAHASHPKLVPNLLAQDYKILNQNITHLGKVL